MTLGEQQRLFTQLVANLIIYADAQGYGITLGESWRPAVTAAYYAQIGAGSKDSLHLTRLAIDLNLFKDGKFLDSTEDHRPLGTYWKTLNPNCRWGGDFTKRPDGNHYSYTPDGVKA